MKLLVVTSRFPYPLEKGDKLRIYHQLAYLNNYIDIHLVCLSEKTPSQGDIEAVKKVCTDLYVFKMPKWVRYFNVLMSIFSSTPFQVAYFYHRGIQNRINAIIKEIKPEYLHAHLIRTSEYIKLAKGTKVLDYMDAFSLAMKRRISKSSLVHKLFYKIESDRLRRYEIKIATLFDTNLVISDQEKSYFKSLGIETQVIPNGVDLDYFKIKETPKKYDVTFVGNMGYFPNVVAAKFLINSILPKLTQGQYEFLLAGARPTAEVKALGAKNVHVSGWLDDIREAYWRSKVMVAPIFSGVGQQNKILEAMACGVPCITTDLVNNAIGAEHGKEIFVCKSVDEFAEAIFELLSDETRRLEISENARKFVQENYSWNSQNKKLLKQYYLENEHGNIT